LLQDVDLQIDRDTVIREVALFAERSDIAEEVIRLATHLEQFLEIMKEKDGAGRKLELMSRTMTRPNGIAFSPDEKWLYVSNSDLKRKIWMRFPVKPDGSLAEGSILLDLTHLDGQAPDGLKVDVAGNLYLTGPGGLWIVAPSGEVLGFIRTRQEPSNAAWGGDDWTTLFLTAPNELYRIRLGVRGTR